ncbi:heme NO-binding domain-containing protein [Bacterioplanoides sp. SCSIO 12839]|uniref:heme NO-binding domain-containing protein n=1 Tax=Bacterioplanoides sp. SCSIO 12839 TaxID=2829569 RepID=UPI00210516DF|nr:heme NO-binding domain-containing protein [Bacterioplanoides sp. SCSIO 12839]UTW47185.1 heme NO-binding domain-containing protein [Bacterioplanoides sp. SCSIO 12839]
MKGIVFDMLRDMVEEQYGLEGWQAVIDQAGSDGLYISTDSYPDAELLGLVAAASDITAIEASDLVFAFGQFMVGEFYKRFPRYFDDCDGLIDFLLSVDRVIHVEVRKLFPDAGVPEFRYSQSTPEQKSPDQQSPDQLTMIYQSQRKLCRLAEGLIDGSAKHFDQSYSLKHPVCMHRGDSACHLIITLQ